MRTTLTLDDAVAKLLQKEVRALTIECGAVLHTAGRDFARSPGLRWLNPLAS